MQKGTSRNATDQARGETRASFKVHPNPFNQQLTIDHLALQPGMIDIALYNVLGQAVYRQEQTVLSGRNTFTLSLDPALASGIYTIRISQEDGSEFVQQIVRNKDE